MAAEENLGELVPVGGGDNIPLIRTPLVLGRRESCDVCLRFPNVSGRHCELFFKDGFWIIRDLDSTNGVRVNGDKVVKKLLHPGDQITIAARTFTIQYTTPVGRSIAELEEMYDEIEEVIDVPLLEKAGLEHPRRHDPLPPERKRKAPPAADPGPALADDDGDDDR
jgi:predicted component of type VI protein secretion system